MASGGGVRDPTTANKSQSEKTIPESAGCCNKCDQADSIDDMVCCDVCSSWEHFHCAGVSGSIANSDRSWKCNRCLVNLRGSAESSVSFNETSVSKSSKKSQRLHLSLLLLEEQQNLKRKQMEAEEAFLKEKYKLLMQIQDAANEDNQKSIAGVDNKQEQSEEMDRKEATEGDTGVTKPASTNHVLKVLDKVTQESPSTVVLDNGGTMVALSEQSSSNHVENTEMSVYTSANPLPESTIPAPSGSGLHLGKHQLQLNAATPLPVKTSTFLEAPFNPKVVSEMTRTRDTLPVSTVEERPALHSKMVTVVSGKTDKQSPLLQSSTMLSMYPRHTMVDTPPLRDQPSMYTNSSLLRSTMDSGGSRNNHMWPPPFSVASSLPSVSRSVTTASQMVQSTTTVTALPSRGILSHNRQSVIPKTTTEPRTNMHCPMPRATSVQVAEPPIVNQQPFVFVPHSNTAPVSDVLLPPPGFTSYDCSVPPGRNQLPVQASLFGQAPQVQQGVRQMEYGGPTPEAQFNMHRVPMVSVMEPQTTNGYGVRNEVYSSSPGPNNAQLAARQVMPRELPKFNGDPQEWPIFYSSFRNTTEVCGYTDAENLARLQRCLGGLALEAVRSRLLLPASVPSVIGTLHKLYGRPEILINSLLKSVRNVPPPKPDNLNSIITYGLAIHNLVDHVVLAGQQAHLANPMLLQEFVDKLPVALRMQWGSYKRSHVNVDLTTFNGFMEELVNVAADLSLDVTHSCAASPKPEKLRQRERLFVHSQPLPGSEEDEAPETAGSNACYFCDSVEHQLLHCNDFKSLDMDGRWKAVRQKNLCRSCLVPHRQWPCRSKKECGVDGCGRRHHKLLHHSNAVVLSSERASESNRTNDPVQLNHHLTKSPSLFRYLPVTLYGKGTQVSTYAFLDDGSSSTLIEEELAKLLGLQGESDTLWLNWTGKIGRHENNSKRVSLKISGDNKNESYQLQNVRTVRELGLPRQTLDYASLAKTFIHLQGLPITSYVDASPRMIIGLEHVRLLTTLKSHEGCPGDPVASRTRLGWCVFGGSDGGENSVKHLNLHSRGEGTNFALCGLYPENQRDVAVLENRSATECSLDVTNNDCRVGQVSVESTKEDFTTLAEKLVFRNVRVPEVGASGPGLVHGSGHVPVLTGLNQTNVKPLTSLSLAARESI